MPEALVSIVISLGPKFAAVPDLSGKDLIAAEALLLEAGLQLGAVTNAYHPSIAKDLVVSQQPPAGSGVERDVEVAVTISKGPEPVIVEEEGEGEGEEEMEGEGEGEDGQPKGCLASPFKAGSLSGLVKRLMGDWLLIGLAMLSLTVFVQVRTS